MRALHQEKANTFREEIFIMRFQCTNRVHTRRENLETVNMTTVEMCAVTQVIKILLSEPKGAARLTLHHTDGYYNNVLTKKKNILYVKFKYCI